jgi:superoxide reductase
MKSYVCKVCGYVSLEGKVDECPICKLKNVFEEKEDAFKLPSFKSETGESEKKHIPLISVHKNCELIDGSTAVRAVMGQITHPSTKEHFINEVTFYLDNKFIANVALTPNVLPAAVVVLKGDVKGKLQVIQTCNIHGKWFNEIQI